MVMIQIQRPEIEALIQHRLTAGGFKTIEAVLLKDAPLPSKMTSHIAGPTGAEIIAAFQRCPVKDFEFELERLVSPISDPVKL